MSRWHGDTAARVIPLGGLGEIGKNITVVETEDDMVLVDAGLAFPDEDMLGVDVVIPDISYVIEHRDKLRGILVTHGHEDHFGALPYVLQELDVPVFASPLPLGLTRVKLEEYGVSLHADSQEIGSGTELGFGSISAEFFRVNHSIADAFGIALHLPVGTVVFTGDYKFDHTPVDGKVADFHILARLGHDGVLALFGDSTNAERRGYTPSESTVGERLAQITQDAPGRILVASFASSIPRIQQVMDVAQRYGRRIAVTGRSMLNTVGVARKLGYLDIPEHNMVDIHKIDSLPDREVCVVCTGSQGEPLSALARMSMGNHRHLEVRDGDTVILAATPVPGNEKSVHRTIDNLYRLGAHVIYGSDAGVHVSGHASQEELKLMMNLLQPRYFIPVHGEERHLRANARLAAAVGIPEDHIFLGENGDVFELSATGVRKAQKVTAGKVLVDGLGVGDVGTVVLRDRRRLAQDGILIVVAAIDSDSGQLLSGPDLISRGFVYMRESEELLDQARDRVAAALADCESRGVTDWSVLKSAVRDALKDFLYGATRRQPMILPIILEL